MRRAFLPVVLLAGLHASAAEVSVSRYLELDASIAPTGDAAGIFAAAAQRADQCGWRTSEAEEHVRCLLTALDGDRPVELVLDGGAETRRLSTLLVERRGDPHALAAAILLLHGERQDIEAVVIERHVLLAVRGDQALYFEPKESGAEMTLGRAFATYGLPFSRSERADADRFRAYYAGHLAIATGDEKLFRFAVKEASSSARLHYDYGAWLLRKNRFDEARKHLGKSTRLGPDFIDAWIDRGIALEKLGRIRPARRSFVQVLRLDPKNAVALSKIKSLDALIAKEVEDERF